MRTVDFQKRPDRNLFLGIGPSTAIPKRQGANGALCDGLFLITFWRPSPVSQSSRAFDVEVDYYLPMYTLP
jgi:hypothetical protein